MTTTRKPNPSQTLTAFIPLMSSIIQGITTNMQSSKEVSFDAVSTTWGGVTEVFQAVVTSYQATLAAKQAVKEAVAAQTLAKAAAVKLLKPVEAALVGQFGSAAYHLFGLAAPTPRAARSTAGLAVSAAKMRSTKAAKQRALAGVTGVSHEESSTALIDAAVAGAPVAAPPAAPAK